MYLILYSKGINCLILKRGVAQFNIDLITHSGYIVESGWGAGVEVERSVTGGRCGLGERQH